MMEDAEDCNLTLCIAPGAGAAVGSGQVPDLQGAVLPADGAILTPQHNLDGVFEAVVGQWNRVRVDGTAVQGGTHDA